MDMLWVAIMFWALGVMVWLLISGRLVVRERLFARREDEFALGRRLRAQREPKVIAPVNAPPLPAWARYEPEAEEPLTHEDAWEARQTLRRLDPETAADLDRTVPLEPPPPPPALSVQVETVEEHYAGVPGHHRHPMRARLVEIVRDLERLMGSATMTDGHFHLTQAQADAYKALVAEGETLRIALDHEQQAADLARKMADEESKREEREADRKARAEQAMANLVRLREIQADLFDTNRRIGNSPERAESMRRILDAIRKIEADMTEAERTAAYALATEARLSASIARPTGFVQAAPSASYVRPHLWPDGIIPKTVEQAVRAEPVRAEEQSTEPWEPGEVVVYQESEPR